MNLPRLVPILSFAVAALGPPIANAQSAADRDQPASLDEPVTIANLERTLINVIARAEPSVVAISHSTQKSPSLLGDGSGSSFADLRDTISDELLPSIVGAGVIIDRRGYVLTQYLAVREGYEHAVITARGDRLPANVRGADPRSGLAVLKIESPDRAPQRIENGVAANSGSYPALLLGDGGNLQKGQFVVAIGNPYAIVSEGEATTSWGTITNLAQKAPIGANLNNAPGLNNDFRTTQHHLGTLIQTDAKLGWNAGGGALVDLDGDLIGLTTTVATIAGHEQPAGYAIPIDGEMRRVIETLKEGREVEYGILGVGFSQSIVNATANSTPELRIAQVYPGGPAAKAGLRAGDAITHIGKQSVNDVDSVQLAISALPPATETRIKYERGGRAATTNVTLAKLAVAGNKIITREPESWQGLRIDYATTLNADQWARAIASGTYDEDGCVLVTKVQHKSVAWQAGVRPGMFISHVGPRRVTTPQEFHAASRELGNNFDIRLTTTELQK